MTPYGARDLGHSPLALVMACCLTAPSHYLNQCWLIINKVEWRSSKGNFTRDASAINHWNYQKKIKYLKCHSNFPGANELSHASVHVYFLRYLVVPTSASVVLATRGVCVTQISTSVPPIHARTMAHALMESMASSANALMLSLDRRVLKVCKVRNGDHPSIHPYSF